MHIFARFFQLSFQRVVWHIPWIIAEDYIWVKSDAYINNLWEHSCLSPDSNPMANQQKAQIRQPSFCTRAQVKVKPTSANTIRKRRPFQTILEDVFIFQWKPPRMAVLPETLCLIYRRWKNLVFPWTIPGKVKTTDGIGQGSAFFFPQ